MMAILLSILLVIFLLTLVGAWFLKHVGLITPVPMDLFTFSIVFGLWALVWIALSIQRYIDWKKLLKRHSDEADRILGP